MNFYKVHAAKFKGSRILFLPEQFDEIGPDAFKQSSFEVIVLSRKVKVIKNYAFSDLKKCKIYIPQTVSEIEHLAFENLDIGNEFYCVPGSVAHKACLENKLKINEDIDSVLALAETLKIEDEKNKPANVVTAQKVDNPAKKRENTSAVKDEIQKNLINNNKGTETKVPMTNISAGEKIEKTFEPIIGEDELDFTTEFSDEDKFDSLVFVQQFGFPPVVDEMSGMGKEWKKQIANMSNQELVVRYDDGDFCPEYRNYCYQEILKRYQIGEFDIEIASEEPVRFESDDEKDYKEISYENTTTENTEEIEEIEITEEIIGMIGFPPRITKLGILADEWAKKIKKMSTREILEQYDSEEYNEEYKFLCYKELTIRSDLKSIIHGF